MNYLKVLSQIAIAGLILSCATYQDRVQPGFDLAKSGQINEAVLHFKKLAQDQDSRDRLAHLLEYATILQMAGRYRESAQVFIQADKLSEELDYISVTQTTMSALSSEELIQYKGESFEKIMINAMNALNFIAMDEIDSALVEVRRIDEKVKKFRRDNREDYEFNPFGTYLSGVLYESLKKWDEAFIAYLRTVKMNNIENPLLLADLNRVSNLSDRKSQLKKEGFYVEELEKSNLGSPDCYSKKKCGRLNVIFIQGWGPVKRASFDNPRYPVLLKRESETRSLSIKINSNIDKLPRIYQTKPVYNVHAAAIATLAADQHALAIRRLGGFVAKEVVADQIRQQDELLGFIAWVVMHISDRADVRQWSLLPETVQILPVDLPEGTWSLEPAGLGSDMRISEFFDSKKVEIKAEKTQFVVLRAKK